jgi:hypothetical protein
VCGGNTPCFTTITAGIAAVASTGTVNVQSASYTENVSVSKAIKLSPGDSPGIVNITGNLTFSTVGASVVLEINGTTPGITGHDQINVTGTVDLNGSDNVNNKVTVTASSTVAPVSLPRLKSSTTTSGESLSIASSVVATESASPTTSKSGVTESRKRRPMRTLA